ncbi:MAG: leucyl/phenylalanyl-tRNA--protein transferase [Syntrophus sp. (in: bacteria)]|nr:leucyl/phenylalanyl-tRNA--protein transferase [Syntrophus sp. (in: bacteria)]
MPIFRLGKEILFPPVSLAMENGLLAVGGDLSPYRLLEAYRQGIFPWYSNGEPILWWAPHPRFVLFPREIAISRSMKQVLRQKRFSITLDQHFDNVISACGAVGRPTQEGTWITAEMEEAYCILHELGYAHSVEVWCGEELAGGLYGVSLGGCFFGESMFSQKKNASKAALIFLAQLLGNLRFTLIDCQVYTSHLASLGARFVPRKAFSSLIRKSFSMTTLRGDWSTHRGIADKWPREDFFDGRKMLERDGRKQQGAPAKIDRLI